MPKVIQSHDQTLGARLFDPSCILHAIKNTVAWARVTHGPSLHGLCGVTLDGESYDQALAEWNEATGSLLPGNPTSFDILTANGVCRVTRSARFGFDPVQALVGPPKPKRPGLNSWAGCQCCCSSAGSELGSAKPEVAGSSPASNAIFPGRPGIARAGTRLDEINASVLRG